MRTPLLRGAALAVAFIALGATACTSPLASCGLIFVNITADTTFSPDSAASPDTVKVLVGDSALASATTASSCPDKIPLAVTFRSQDSTIASVRALNDTLAVVYGLKADTTGLVAQSTARSNIRSGIPIVVLGP